MADDVPVCNVLCEAMEYLSKLGSNLRSRSEALKVKKIRKDKLKNAHAVQKAANKVLLICELSKKSLENVETGVKKVLQIVDASQASTSIGGNSSKTDSSSNKRFHYFEYRSRRLKISKKVSIQHYMSAKVMAKQLPKPMQDKYPVYYDCKLYRLRKKMALKEEKENMVSSERNDLVVVSKKLTDIEEPENDEVISLCESNDTENSKKKTKSRSNSQNSIDNSDKEEIEQDIKISENQINKSVDIDKFSNDTKENAMAQEINLAEDTVKHDEVDNHADKSITDSDVNEKIDYNLKETMGEEDVSKNRTDSSDSNIVLEKSTSLKPSKTEHKNKSVPKISITQKKDRRKKLGHDSSDSEVTIDSSKKSIRSRKIKNRLDSDDSSSSRENKNKKPDKNNKRKIRVIDDSSDSDKEITQGDKNKDKNVVDLILESEHNQIESKSEKSENSNTDCKNNDIKSKSEKSENTNTDSENNEEESISENTNIENLNQDSESQLVKPFIKCVNLSKLLKPDILHKEDLCENKKNKSNKTSSHFNENNRISQSKKHTDSTHKSNKQKLDDDEFWAQKRKEVAAFNPKICTVDIIRLPEICVSLLYAHNINKITHNGAIICDINKEDNSSRILSSQSQCEITNKTRIDDPDIKIVKEALLIDSDSDKSESDSSIVPDKQTTKGKQVLKEKSENESCDISRMESLTEKEENSQCDGITENENTDSLLDKSTKFDRQSRESDNIKNTLLKDSESDKDDKPKNDIENTKTKKGLKSKLRHKKNTVPSESDASEKHEQVHECNVISANDINVLQSNRSNEEKVEINKNKSKCDANDTEINEVENVKKSLLNESDSDVEKPVSDANQNNDTVVVNASDINVLQSDRSNEENDEKNKNESKCDVNDTETNEVETVKKSLLNESDSDVEKPISDTNENNDTVDPSFEMSLQCSQDSIDSLDSSKNAKISQDMSGTHIDDKTNKTPERGVSPATEDPQQVKTALLHDSSSDSEKICSKRRKCSESTPSKRKHIMESMHAKKMLLTYSSSSETEDEKLNEVLKEIKEYLLKGISSDEEQGIKLQCRRKKSSSESEGEDNVKKVKRKRRASKSKKPAKEFTHGEESDDKTHDSDSHKVERTMDEKSNSSSSKMGRSKPGSSSSHNSDTQDDKDIDGLTNLKSLNKSRRRQESPSNQSTATSTSSRRTKMAKIPPLITGEGLLEAPVSSDEPSGAESEIGEEELPSVSLSGLNGSSIDHLAKDDLLEESDSSSSHEKSEDKKEEDSDNEENVKLKRRKAQAISSDSEVGSSRRKGQDVKVSDFEDSEEESSEPVKKNKRKKKASDSDASAGSSTEGKKKRRRIKSINDSDASGSDTENEGRNKHGRKNIRKVMGKNQLEEATKKAARQEKERIARIAERQKLYNNLEFDESGKPDEVVLDKVVLDFDPETKEPLIEVDRGLVKKLKPHQANGIKFMWDACFESVKRIKKDKGSGCILAHCMGLGKTLQVVSLTHTLLTHGELTGVNRVLVVCPLSTVLNWVNEFRMWLKHAERDYEVDVYELSRYKQNSERAFQLSQWFTCGGVCVLGYEMFRNLSADNPKKFKKKMLRNFQESLVDPGPDLVVCDEGHLLKNEKTSLSQSMNRVKTQRRIVLTGTPLQNNLKEYYCMVQFVKPNLLGKYNEYLNRFVNPITNGQYTDSTEHDIRVMKRRSHVLHKMLDGAVQRRDYGVLAPFLPPKHEYVLFITLTEVQIKLYQHYLDNYSRRPLPGKSSGFLFPDFQSLQRIWTHPLVLKYNSERYEIMQQKKREREEEDSEGSLADFIDDDSTPEETSTEESTDDSSDMSDDSRKKSKKKKSGKKSKSKDSKVSARRGTRANPVELEEDDVNNSDVIEVKNENPTEWWIPLVTDDEVEDMRNSHKLVLLFEILRQCEAVGDKLLVFSQSLYSLDLIEHFLGKVDEATQEGRIDEKLGGHVGSWSPGIDYFRLDGSTSCENRSIWCKNFNREDNPRARLFLISTRAGGLGINLVAANRVVIFDVSWNPSHDVQSIFRVYRFGQKKPCYIYRFLAMGTMEEKIYERQVTKQAISKRVIDEQQIDRHYAENDLAELYKFEPRPPAPRPVPLVPKDRLFAEMIKDHDGLIYKFHEHDSLLENKEEETLSEEERKAAWEDFENEKNRPPPAPFPSAWPMHNGMAGLLAQQQQQLAYAALGTMLRKDMPNLTDDQIRNMLPLIYGANPGLMQKLNDIYKYPQPGMMNPMMNSVMNAGGGGMAGGGTSGLQYEPPWAREQQQQQQMRLQQLMQQQNMGAKYYAGGLGSRDPVAMALQQQRAREIMLGERGRPRGRPPLQPRGPLPAGAHPHPPPPGDVVNLADSD